MSDLAEVFRDAGCEEVRTYIASGNVVYRARAALARRVPALVEAAIAARCGFESPVVTRSAAEMEAIVRSNPYAREAAKDHKTVHVAFLRDRPSAAQVAALDPDRSPPDTFVVTGREVYLHLPNGVAGSRITTAWLDARLGTIGTSRNWRTVASLHRMTLA